jgi:hypothetical protein
MSGLYPTRGRRTRRVAIIRGGHNAIGPPPADEVLHPAPNGSDMGAHPIDRWLRAHHLHLRIALAVCAVALVLGLALGIDLLTDVAAVATTISGTLVMLYLPRSRP